MRDSEHGWSDPLGGPEWGWGSNGSPFGSNNSSNGGSSSGGCGCLFPFIALVIVLGIVSWTVTLIAWMILSS